MQMISYELFKQGEKASVITLEIMRKCIKSILAKKKDLGALLDAYTTPQHNALKIIVPRKAIMELLKLLAEVDADINLLVAENHVRFGFANLILTARLFAGEFPNYQGLITDVGTNEVLADNALLQATLSRAAVLCDDKNKGVGLHFKPGKVEIFATDGNHDKIEDVLEIAYTGANIDIGFNVKYLLEILKAIASTSTQVRIIMQDATSRVLLQGLDESSAKYVIMPMRI
ncbi:MAG: hypothetical protein COC15_04740 [Legionellales bacterium]|nr:MAG: hypothetical protein COC15_04740 [Legionellales bacterium]